MAERMDDDWDSTSSVGSPSSSLPQSIKEVLESVRAECNSDNVLGAFYSSNVNKLSITSRDEGTEQIDDGPKDMITSSPDQTGVACDRLRGLSQTERCLITTQVSDVVEEKKTPHDTLEVSNTHSGHQVYQTKMTECIDLTDDVECPELEIVEEGTTIRRRSASSRLGNGVSRPWYKGTFTVTSGKELRNEDRCNQARKYKPAMLPNETIDLSRDDVRAQKKLYVMDTHCIDLTDDPESSEHQSLKLSVNQGDEQDRFMALEKKDGNGRDGTAALERSMVPSEVSIMQVKQKQHWSTHKSKTSMEVQETYGPQTDVLPEVLKQGKLQSDCKAGVFPCNEDFQAGFSQPVRETNPSYITKEPTTYGEHETSRIQTNTVGGKDPMEGLLNKELKGTSLSQSKEDLYSSFSEHITPIEEKHQEYEPSGYEESEKLVMACNDLPQMTVREIKVELFNDETPLAIQDNIDESSKDEFDRESRRSTEEIWRQELLSSDFNLVYGSLRAVLMKNISEHGRHRLIQTMIATMSEIEQVTMGEGNPTLLSVRCETPELTEDINEMEGYKSESNVSRNEEIKEEYKDESDVCSNEGMKEGHKPAQLPAEGLIRASLATENKSILRGKEAILNLQRIEQLTEYDTDGTLMCLVCNSKRLSRTCCRGCSAFTYRIEKKYTLGIPLPTCSHTNYSGGSNCRSCRFRKYSFLSMNATSTRVRQVKAKECPICRKSSYFTRGWNCVKCYSFFLKLVRRKVSMPSCTHNGEFPGSCDGCRRYNLQVEWANHETKRAYPLPLVERNTIKREK